MWFNFSFLFLLITCSFSTKLPENFKKCSESEENFESCLIQSAHQVLELLDKDIKEVGLQNLQPLDSGANILPKGKQYVNFEQNFKNLKLNGFKNSRISKFTINFSTKLINLDFVVPELGWIFDMKFNGTLFSDPVDVESPGIGTMKNVSYVITMTLEEYKKRDKTHLKIIETDLKMTPETIFVQFDRVLNGTEEITEKFNKKINDNVRILWNDVKPNHDKFFGRLVASNFNRFFNKVPISELF